MRFILPRRDGSLLAGHRRRLESFKNGVFQNYTTREGLSNDYVRAILEEPDGTLWLGTYGGGVNYFKDGRFTSITRQDGLFDDFISRILEDDAERYWMLSNHGIFWVSRQELRDFVAGRLSSITATFLRV